MMFCGIDSIEKTLSFALAYNSQGIVGYLHVTILEHGLVNFRPVIHIDCININMGLSINTQHTNEYQYRN